VTISSRDRRALLLLGLCLIGLLGWRILATRDVASPEAAAIAMPVSTLEKRLGNLRQRAALNPSKAGVREQLASVVEEREKALLRADTPQQAQAALLAKVRGILESQDPPLRAGQMDLVPMSKAGEDYGEVAVTVAFSCAVEQLVNVLSDLAALPEAIATRNVAVSLGNRQKKVLNVRLTVSALTPRELVPEATGGLIR
jgi:hypothetical protein